MHQNVTMQDPDNSICQLHFWAIISGGTARCSLVRFCPPQQALTGVEFCICVRLSGRCTISHMEISPQVIHEFIHHPQLVLGPRLTCLKRSKGRDREGVPVRKMALRLRLTAETAASVCRASGGFSLVRRVWLSSAMMIFQPLDARQCCMHAS